MIYPEVCSKEYSGVVYKIKNQIGFLLQASVNPKKAFIANLLS